MDTVLDQLEQVVGSGGILRGDAVKERATSWSDPTPCQGLAILRPATTEEVAAVLALCNQHGIGVIPVGGATGLVGAVAIAHDQAGLSLERMDRVEAIDARQKTAVVQAGVPLQVVHEQVAEHGCHFSVDLGARGSATIGGMVATNAGGTEVLRFGMMREQVLGLEVVLADGQVLSSMRPLLKNNTGYDLKQLFIGAEGTLGIVTKVLLRLRPRPASLNTALVATRCFADVVALLTYLQQRLGQSLACFEVMWQSFSDQILSYNRAHQAPFSEPYPFSILVEASGSSPDTDRAHFHEVLEGALEQSLIEDALICTSIDQQQALWAIRDDIDTLMGSLEAGQMFDVSLPLEHIGGYVDDLESTLVARFADAKVVTFGHVGDGNIHLAISLGADLPAEKSWLTEQVYGPLESLQGSISAEHGIGLDKKPYLHINRTPMELELMRRLKQVFDPNEILSPGRIF